MKRLFSVFSGILFSIVMIGVSGGTAQDGAPRTIKGGVLNGKAISLPKPEYTDEAKKAGVEGTIAVAITIDEEGNVEVCSNAAKGSADQGFWGTYL